jgi:hypothetical protein
VQRRPRRLRIERIVEQLLDPGGEQVLASSAAPRPRTAGRRAASIFGNPPLGTQFITANPNAGLDLLGMILIGVGTYSFSEAKNTKNFPKF